MPIKFSKDTSTRLFRYVKTIDIKFNREFGVHHPFRGSVHRLLKSFLTMRFLSLLLCKHLRRRCYRLLLLLVFHAISCFLTAFDNRTKSAREIWRQMQATRYHKANPKLKINTEVLGSAAAPEVVFKFIDDTEVSSRTYSVTHLWCDKVFCFDMKSV